MIAATIVTPEMIASQRMNLEANQSSRWPLSRTICRPPEADRNQAEADVVHIEAFLEMTLLGLKLGRVGHEPARQ